MNSSPPISFSPPSKQLAALHLPGLNLDSLGNYLAAIGLLCLAKRKWPTVRGCWNDECFVLVGGPSSLDALEPLLHEIAEAKQWSTYEKTWETSQKADTKAQSAMNTNLWRSRDADEAELSMSQAHIATGQKLNFNPVFGNGGIAGNRDFAKGWNRAVTLLGKPPRGTSRADLNADLHAFLTGRPCNCLNDFNAACWFSAANKAYNSGASKPYRGGQLTPWAMLFACEAFPLFRGSTSRRLGAGRRASGAFPFVVAGAAPDSAKECGRNVGEAWLPVWARPMAMQEVEAVFARGRAEVNGKGAVTAAAFAAAIIQRGVDAGLSEFRRFSLLRTTSEKTFESRLTRVIPLLGKKNHARAEAAAVALGLRDSFPPDRMQGQRWIYAGLQGPIDRALTEYAASETATDAIAVVDGMVTSLGKADRNRNHRARGISFSRLPGSWLSDLCQDGLSAEARIGLAIASLKGSKTVGTLLPYWLGVTPTFKGWLMPENCPFRRVWAPTTLQQNLVAVVHRRFVDMKEVDPRPPFSGLLSAPLADIARWMHGELDDCEIERWMQRFSLFTFDAIALTEGQKQLRAAREPVNLSADIAVFALLKPLFEPELFEQLMRDTPGNKPPRCARISRIAALLSRNDLSAAVKLARETWHASGVRLIEVPIPYDSANDADICQRLLGAMLMPVWPIDLLPIFRRWCVPIKNYENKQ